MISGHLPSLVLHSHHAFSSPSLGRRRGGGEPGWEKGEGGAVLGFLGGEEGPGQSGLTVSYYNEDGCRVGLKSLSRGFFFFFFFERCIY